MTSFFGVWFLYNKLMYVMTVLFYGNLVYNRKKITLKSPVLNLQIGVLISASLLRVISFPFFFYSIISKFKGVSLGADRI